MIILCVTGSVAAGQSVKLAREFKRQGMEVKCFMSEAACKILHPNSMEFATGSEVITELTGNIEHVKYSQEDFDVRLSPFFAAIAVGLFSESG